MVAGLIALDRRWRVFRLAIAWAKGEITTPCEHALTEIVSPGGNVLLG